MPLQNHVFARTNEMQLKYHNSIRSISQRLVRFYCTGCQLNSRSSHQLRLYRHTFLNVILATWGMA